MKRRNRGKPVCACSRPRPHADSRGVPRHAAHGWPIRRIISTSLVPLRLIGLLDGSLFDAPVRQMDRITDGALGTYTRAHNSVTSSPLWFYHFVGSPSTSLNRTRSSTFSLSVAPSDRKPDDVVRVSSNTRYTFSVMGFFFFHVCGTRVYGDREYIHGLSWLACLFKPHNDAYTRYATLCTIHIIYIYWITCRVRTPVVGSSRTVYTLYTLPTAAAVGHSLLAYRFSRTRNSAGNRVPLFFLSSTVCGFRTRRRSDSRFSPSKN